MTAERLLRVADVAEQLDIHPETVRVWLRDGRLRGVRLGGDKLGWRIPASELERIMQPRRKRPIGRTPARYMARSE